MWNLVIIGAGPAGLTAGIAAAENGVAVKVIDECPRPGGRLLGQVHEEPNGEWWNGIQESENLVDRAESLGVEIECETSVYNLEKIEAGWRIYTSSGAIDTVHLLLATGASETHIPLPGWKLPGVMSIGAAQVMGNVHRVKPGNSCIIIGANVLSMAIANELKLCGVDVKAIILPVTEQIGKEAGQPQEVLASLMRLTHLAPSPLLKQLGKLGKHVPVSFATKFYPSNGLKMNGIPIKLKTAVTEIIGEDVVEGVKTVKINTAGEPIPGTEKTETADVVCISGGLTPMAELASVVGCSFKYVEALGGHIPVHNEKMETTLPDLYVSGNITGVESSKVAMAQGEVAGLNIASKVIGENPAITERIERAIQNVKKVRAAALIQFHPEIEKDRETLYQDYQQHA